jgi:hypothetical protein
MATSRSEPQAPPGESLQRRLAADRHYHAVLSAEARRIARELSAYGPQTPAMLARRCRARRWRQGTLEAAVLVGVQEGRLRRLPLGFLTTADGDRDGAPQPPAARR